MPSGFVVDDGDKILLDNDDNDETIPISEIGTLRFEDILRKDKLILGTDPKIPSLAVEVEQNNANAIENVGIMLENNGQLQLNGTDTSSSNADDYLLQETTKLNRFQIEETGSLVVEDTSPESIVELLLLNGTDDATGLVDAGDEILLEDSLKETSTDNIKLRVVLS